MLRKIWTFCCSKRFSSSRELVFSPPSRLSGRVLGPRAAGESSWGKLSDQNLIREKHRTETSADGLSGRSLVFSKRRFNTHEAVMSFNVIKRYTSVCHRPHPIMILQLLCSQSPAAEVFLSNGWSVLEEERTSVRFWFWTAVTRRPCFLVASRPERSLPDRDQSPLIQACSDPDDQNRTSTCRFWSGKPPAVFTTVGINGSFIGQSGQWDHRDVRKTLIYFNKKLY